MTNESPLLYARTLASADLRNQTSQDESRWLNDHPLLWLRALTQLKRDVENHIYQDRLKLNTLLPNPGQAPSAEYLKHKRERDERTRRRTYFMRVVSRRKNEVAALCGAEVATPLMGEIINSVVKIIELIDAGDHSNARDLADNCVTRWMNHA